MSLSVPTHPTGLFRARANLLRGGLIVPGLIVIACVTMALVEPRFFGRPNVLNVVRNFSLSSVVAVGQMFVIMVGGFDMAIGASAALASVAAASAMIQLSAAGSLSDTVVVAAGLGAGLGAGALLGIVNSAVVLWLDITPFMATLATAAAVMGGVLYFTNGVPIYGLPDVFTDTIGRSFTFGLPSVVWICAAFVLLCWWTLGMTTFGQSVRAVGGNERAARAAGLSPNRTKIVCYTLSGLSGALLGVLLTARIGTGDASFGASAPMESIAAAVLGGTALTGGAGRIGRVLPATFLLAIVSNALNLAQIDSKWQACVLGVILICAMIMDKD